MIQLLQALFKHLFRPQPPSTPFLSIIHTTFYTSRNPGFLHRTIV
jgi:hypothetical protein